MGKFAGIEFNSFNPILSGIINLSPESFYKNSSMTSSEMINEALLNNHKFESKIIDVGARSTRPVTLYGKLVEISVDEELNRVKKFLPSIQAFCSKHELLVSIDTQYTKVARYAIGEGVEIVNDISGFTTDPEMLGLCKDEKVSVVVMASKEKPGDVVSFDDTFQTLKRIIENANSKGLPSSKLAIDPAFGGWQGRSQDIDLELIQRFTELTTLNSPIYVGVSRKSTIKTLGGGVEPEKRLSGSLVLTAHLIKQGANIIRTHDVEETRYAINVNSKILELSE